MGEVDNAMEDSPDTEKGTAKFSTGSEQIPAGQVLTLAAGDRKSTRLNSSHLMRSRMPSSA